MCLVSGLCCVVCVCCVVGYGGMVVVMDEDWVGLYRETNVVIELYRVDKNRKIDNVYDYMWCGKRLCI